MRLKDRKLSQLFFYAGDIFQCGLGGCCVCIKRVPRKHSQIKGTAAEVDRSSRTMVLEGEQHLAMDGKGPKKMH